MKLSRFVRCNRLAIDQVIHRAGVSVAHMDDDEREAWVLNDEGLYNWARSIGVDV